MNERLHLQNGVKHIDTVIFDFGGVLLNLDPDKCRAAFHAIGIHKIEQFIDRYRPKGLFFEFEYGAINRRTFLDELHKLTDKTVSDQVIIDAYTSFLIELPIYKLQLLRELRKNHKVWLLSNINELCFSYCRDNFFTQEGLEINDYFDKLYMSFQMGVCKPDLKIFEMMLADSGLKPETALFIDDSKNNTEVADRFGINTYLALPEEDYRPLFSLPVF